MPLPTFETVDAIPEPFRDLYEVVDGKPVPKDDAAPLKTALEKERKAAQDAAARAKALEQRTLELETQAKAQKAGITDEQLAQIKADALKEIDPVKSENAALKAELRSMKLDTAVKGIMASHGVRSERLDVMWKVIADRFDLTEEGKPILKASPTADLPKVMLDLKTEFPEFFLPPTASGGGALPSAGTLPTAGAPGAHELFKSGLTSMRRAS